MTLTPEQQASINQWNSEIGLDRDAAIARRKIVGQT